MDIKDVEMISLLVHKGMKEDIEYFAKLFNIDPEELIRSMISREMHDIKMNMHNNNITPYNRD